MKYYLKIQASLNSPNFYLSPFPRKGENSLPHAGKKEKKGRLGGGVPHQILLFLIEKHYKRNEIQERYLPKGGIKI